MESSWVFEGSRTPKIRQILLKSVPHVGLHESTGDLTVRAYLGKAQKHSKWEELLGHFGVGTQAWRSEWSPEQSCCTPLRTPAWTKTTLGCERTSLCKGAQGEEFHCSKMCCPCGVATLHRVAKSGLSRRLKPLGRPSMRHPSTLWMFRPRFGVGGQRCATLIHAPLSLAWSPSLLVHCRILQALGLLRRSMSKVATAMCLA